MHGVRVGRAVKQVCYVIEECVRIVGMLVLSAAARVLPGRWAVGIANILPVFLIALPQPGLQAYWELRSAFGSSRLRSFSLAWARLARPFRDFVVHKRIAFAREDTAQWRIVERNVGAINMLRASGKPYIVAPGHFAQPTMLAMFAPQITPGRAVALSNSAPQKIRTLKDLRTWIQARTLFVAMRSCWRRPFELVLNGQDPFPSRTLLNRLLEPGNVVFIHIDAPWEGKSTKGSFRRPFAGDREHTFATGAVQLARLAQCPIISCVYLSDRDGTRVLEWGEVIRPASEPASSDVDVMNRLLDVLEAPIGEHPTQYIQEIGYGRRWNPKTRCWQDLPA